MRSYSGSETAGSLGACSQGAAEAAVLPFADRADVDVDELADGVVADAASAEAEGGIAQDAGLDAGDPDVDGFCEHVLAVLGDAGGGGPGAEIVVALRGSVAADDVDEAIGAAEPGHDGVEQIEFGRIVAAFRLRSMVAQEEVQFFERVRQVDVADAVDDVEVFARVQVVQVQGIPRAGRGCRGGACGSDDTGFEHIVGLCSLADGQKSYDGRHRDLFPKA